MLKKILLIGCMCIITAYLVAAVTIFNRQSAEKQCEHIQLIVKDTVENQFISNEEIISLLKKKKLYPVGNITRQINCNSIEQELNKHPLISQTECYKTPSGNLCIEVHQRIPILRVMNQKGENYYIDNKGSIISPKTKCLAHLVIATGNVEKSFAMRDLYKFGLFLQNNPFWNAQIEQINVLPGNNIELVPRVGNHIVYIGSLEQFEQKLDRLKSFYQKGLCEVGWNKYSKINVEFGNQIICTKH